MTMPFAGDPGKFGWSSSDFSGWNICSHGSVTDKAEYLQETQQLAAEYGALFILDEAQTLRWGSGSAESSCLSVR